MSALVEFTTTDITVGKPKHFAAPSTLMEPWGRGTLSVATTIVPKTRHMSCLCRIAEYSMLLEPNKDTVQVVPPLCLELSSIPFTGKILHGIGSTAV
jgi:hypothetical protein